MKDIFYQDLLVGDFVLRVSTSSQDSRIPIPLALQGGKPHLSLARITEIKLQAPRRRGTIYPTTNHVSEIKFIYNIYHPTTGWKVRHGRTLVLQENNALDFFAIDFLKINPENDVYRNFVDRLIEYQRLHGVL